MLVGWRVCLWSSVCVSWVECLCVCVCVWDCALFSTASSIRLQIPRLATSSGHHPRPLHPGLAPTHQERAESLAAKEAHDPERPL